MHPIIIGSKPNAPAAWPRSYHNREDVAILEQVAQEYDDIVEDLETGAIEIRHPELMPQRRR